MAFDVFDAGLDGAEEEWAGYSDLGERLACDARFEGGEIGGDVGEFWHGELFAGMITDAEWRASCSRT